MKSYLRYEPKKSFGVIASPQCNITYDCSGNLAITGALQEISVWNLRQANQVSFYIMRLQIRCMSVYIKFLSALYAEYLISTVYRMLSPQIPLHNRNQLLLITLIATPY